MIKDTELFTLCKQVYEATGWKSDEFIHPHTGRVKRVGFDMFTGDEVPHYTSDYLLEKLPWSTVCSGPNEGMYAAWLNGKSNETFQESDTPLKALLKLSIELAEEGLL